MPETENKDAGVYFFTKPTIMTFPALFTPRRVKRNGKETGEPRYEANFIFEPEAADWLALKALAVNIAKAHNVTDFTTIGFPFKSGTKEADKRIAKGKKDGEFARNKGIMIARSGEKYPPRLTVIEGSQAIDLDTDDLKTKWKAKFYSGVKVHASVNLQWYDAVGEGGRPGVTARLNVVVSTGKGERIGGGGQSGSQLMQQYLGGITGEDPTAGMDEEIPF